ncbi:YqaA family protein [Porticoccus sp. W117]|uniref:YqaA family protein n=1 Tax=Porticoccus sp. W117 TaxID=3054777 RepID=UPI0025994AED|nr:YqaA family protein [Porticoccus sp. W117]MDM3871525.1 YqaA family protein [Porticoccus sp. W117]
MPYLSLFTSAFLAATLLPLGSEVLLGALVIEGYSPLWLWITATTGNTLGAVVNWYLGLKLLHFQDRRWFPFKPDKLRRAQAGFQKYGTASLLFAWLPIVGDPLTFVAGLMKTRLLPFVILVGLGKGARYGVVLAVALNLHTS